MLASQFDPTMRTFNSFYAEIPGVNHRKPGIFVIQRRGSVLRGLAPRELRSICLSKRQGHLPDDGQTAETASAKSSAM